MTFTNKKLAEFAKSKLNVNSAYMWGEFGRLITKSTISQKAAQYPSKYSADRQALLLSYVGKNYYGCDCVGLYKWFLWTDGGTSSSIKYSAATDRGTGEMFSAATEKGKISTLPEIEGIILYMSGHVGVYIGNGECVECTLGKYGDGIVKTKVEGRGWTYWLKMPEITYEEEKKTEFKVGDDVIISGDLYSSANATKASGTVSNKKTKITRYSAGAKHPYNTTGDLGWMNASDIKPVEGQPVVKVESKTVTPSVGLWLNNSDVKWNSSTHIVLMPKGAIVTYYPGTEKKLGNYTSVKVTYNGKTGYCAKEYLK